MKKIVINKCFGGFGISYEGMMEYAKLSGFKLYAYSDKEGADWDLPEKDRLEEIKNAKDAKDKKDAKGSFIITYYKDKNFKEYFFHSDIERDDINLVKVVEKLGNKVDGRCSELKVVEIPDDIKWEIDEYDGMESIEEEHKSWG